MKCITYKLNESDAKRQIAKTKVRHATKEGGANKTWPLNKNSTSDCRC